MITKATNTLPEIEWHNTKVERIDTVDRSAYYLAHGIGSDGKKYGGCAEYCCGELIEITDIEEV